MFRLGRRIPLLLALEVLIASREHWNSLSPVDRRRAGELLRKSKGDPRRLSAQERQEAGRASAHDGEREEGVLREAERRRERVRDADQEQPQRAGLERRVGVGRAPVAREEPLRRLREERQVVRGLRRPVHRDEHGRGERGGQPPETEERAHPRVIGRDHAALEGRNDEGRPQAPFGRSFARCD